LREKGDGNSPDSWNLQTFEEIFIGRSLSHEDPHSSMIHLEPSDVNNWVQDTAIGQQMLLSWHAINFPVDDLFHLFRTAKHFILPWIICREDCFGVGLIEGLDKNNSVASWRVANWFSKVCIESYACSETSLSSMLSRSWPDTWLQSLNYYRL
jgi:hypothetical protein